MGRQQKAPLRSLSKQETAELTRIGKARSARLDQVQRARALLAVAESRSFSQAAQLTGFSNEAAC
jgi:uncharacterized protein (DUF2336 family)